MAKELVANLSADYQARVATVPIVFDPNPNDVNAFAACDNGNAPFVAATEGLLDAIDAIAETRATDELFGTQTYQAYASLVAPRIVSKGGGSALLPAGVIAPVYWVDPRRISRAHEISTRWWRSRSGTSCRTTTWATPAARCSKQRHCRK